jgi:hypothetical protein
LLLLGFASLVRAGKLSIDDRLAIERGMTAEYATLKVALPRAKKPLVIHPDGSYDKSAWESAMYDGGPCARPGDQIQITRVLIEAKKIVFEINGGTHSGHWYDHVQVGMGPDLSPVTTNQSAQQAQGSNIALVFPGGVPALQPAQIRQMLSSVFDFEKHSASDVYFDRLPAPVKQAIQEKRAITGMDRDEVLMAMGKPRNKSRETDENGDEIEDWIYGDPPGKITFVTFDEGKVVKIEESYANLGGRTSPPLPPVR